MQKERKSTKPQKKSVLVGATAMRKIVFVVFFAVAQLGKLEVVQKKRGGVEGENW